jgi:hypothetical protein
VEVAAAAVLVYLEQSHNAVHFYLAVAVVEGVLVVFSFHLP